MARDIDHVAMMLSLALRLGFARKDQQRQHSEDREQRGFNGRKRAY
jgi:hypothetical protein